MRTVGSRPSAALAALLALAVPPFAAAEVADTLIAGQRYRLVPVEELVHRLEESHRDTVRDTGIAVTGALFPARFARTTIECVVDLDGVRFVDPVALDGLVFERAVRLRNAVFERGLSVRDARFGAAADFGNLRSHTHVNFKRTAFEGPAVFSGARVEELCSFIETRFSGPSVTFARGRFGRTTFFEAAVFAGTADFGDVHFEGITSFKEATWSDAVSFAGARFKDRADFLDARFHAAATFDQAKFSTLVFDRAEVDGEASFHRATFIHPARFSHTVFRSAVSFAGSIFMHHADFSSARFDAPFELASHVDRTLDLRHSSGPVLDLQLPPWQQSVARRDQVFSDSARVLLQGSRYDRIRVRWQDLAGHLAAGEDGIEGLRPVYAQLRAQFSTAGQADDAAASRVEWLERRRLHLDWTQAEWYWLQLRRLTTGYGADSWQFARFALAGILLFAGLYRLLYPSLRAQVPARLAPSLGCLYLSLVTFLRLLPAARPGAGAAYAVILVEAAFAWVCWGLFIATLLGFDL